MCGVSVACNWHNHCQCILASSDFYVVVYIQYVVKSEVTKGGSSRRDSLAQI